MEDNVKPPKAKITQELLNEKIRANIEDKKVMTILSAIETLSNALTVQMPATDQPKGGEETVMISPLSQAAIDAICAKIVTLTKKINPS